MNYFRCLTIAGSDPSGGAGLQADLKTFSACGCYGASVVVAVVDENTVTVKGVHPIPVDFVAGQIQSVLEDIGADAIKIGMLHSSELIRTVKDKLLHFQAKNIVLDPVMVATSGDRLLLEEAIDTLKNELIPLARIITPNIPEAEILLGRPIVLQEDLPTIAQELSDKYHTSVLLKAGHLKDELLIDVFYNAENQEYIKLSSPRQYTQNTHGTGCTLSSAITAFLAKGMDLNEAVINGKNYIKNAIEHGTKYQIGNGHGPVHHFFQWWK